MVEEERLKLKEQTEHPTLRVADADEPSKINLKPAEPSADGSEKEIEKRLDNSVPSANQGSGAGQSVTHQTGGPEGLPTGLPEQELLGLAAHPNTPESEWLKACAELNRREQLPPAGKSDNKPKKSNRLPYFAAGIALAAGAAAWFFFAHPPDREHSGAQAPKSSASPVNVVHPVKPTPYMRHSASFQKIMLQHNARFAVANAIAENEWSDAEAASNLHVSQQEIHALMRDDPIKFSIDDLTEMLMIMGKSPDFLKVDQKGMVYSPSSAGMNSRAAIAYYTRAISLGNNREGVYVNRALAHRELKEYDLAIADYTRCIEMGNRDMLEDRATVYSAAGNYQAALKDLNELLRVPSNSDTWAYQDRATVYMTMGDYKNAIKDSTESIARMKTPRPGPYSNRAMSEEDLGMYREALADYQKSLDCDPTYTFAIEKVAALKTKLSGR